MNVSPISNQNFKAVYMNNKESMSRRQLDIAQKISDKLNSKVGKSNISYIQKIKNNGFDIMIQPFKDDTVVVTTYVGNDSQQYNGFTSMYAEYPVGIYGDDDFNPQKALDVAKNAYNTVKGRNNRLFAYFISAAAIIGCIIYAGRTNNQASIKKSVQITSEKIDTLLTDTLKLVK